MNREEQKVYNHEKMKRLKENHLCYICYGPTEWKNGKWLVRCKSCSATHNLIAKLKRQQPCLDKNDPLVLKIYEEMDIKIKKDRFI